MSKGTAKPGKRALRRDIQAIFAAAETAGKAGLARKTKPVDARRAQPGEVVVTLIAGEGKETQSPPAAAGDMVVRNRCPGTGHEQYLVEAQNFAARYEGPFGEPETGGWREYRPIARDVKYIVVGKAMGAFIFTAPWGEDMVALPGDAIVQTPGDPADTYRVAAASFACTYTIRRAAP